MKILFIGDIIARIGRRAVKTLLPSLISKYNIDFISANGENSAGGFGITEKTAIELFDMGVHVITTGNHVWDKKDIIPFISQQTRLIRALNYPPGVPGVGSTVYSIKNGLKVGVINLSGRVFMTAVDCPFRAVLPEIEKIKKETNIILVDFHAEATSEKRAMGYHLNGHVSAVVGTHTHVQTADECVLSGRTAYITDVGMTGPKDSVIGVNISQIINKFLTQMPTKYEVARGAVVLCGVVIDIDEVDGCARGITRIAETINPEALCN